MAGGGTTEQIRGRVEQTNEKGLKVDGRWFNWSRFSNSSVRPQEGDDVELEIARGKFINDARIVGEGGQNTLSLEEDDAFMGLPAAPRAARPASAPAGESAGVAAPPRAATAPNADRNTEIRRLALIKAAVDFAVAKDMDAEDVVALAARWEEWVAGRQ